LHTFHRIFPRRLPSRRAIDASVALVPRDDRKEAGADVGAHCRRVRRPDDQAPSRRELIEQRAYEISLSTEAEGDLDNWLRAEREVQALENSD
jgi:hypothetical protein